MVPRDADTLTIHGTRGTFSLRVLLVLLAGDILFMGLHATYSATGAAAEGLPSWHRLTSIYTDGGYAERFQYLKWIGIAGVLVLAGQRTGNRLFTAFAAVFLMVFLDDALQLHERGGRVLAGLMPVFRPRFFRMQDLGELGAWAALGLLVVSLLAWAYRRSSSAERRSARPLAILFAALLLVGIGTDMLHIMLARIAGALAGPEVGSLVNGGMGLLEDGGEMILATLIAAVSVGIMTDRDGNLPGIR